MKTRFRMTARSCCDRRGITLLDVLLSAVILAMSLAALGQLVSNGVTAGLRCERQTEAAVRCQSKLDELLAGVEPLRAVSAVPCSDDSRWLWSVEIEQLDNRLRRVTVSVRTVEAKQPDFSLTRLLRERAEGRSV